MTTIEQTDLRQTNIEQTDVDAAAVEEFAAKLIETITSGLITCLIEIGRRVGLFELAAAGTATSAELAKRGGLQERYVREWLAAMSTASIVEYDADNGRFWLPVEHAAVLTGDTYNNLAPVAYLASVVIQRGAAVAKCFTDGGACRGRRTYRRCTTSWTCCGNRCTATSSSSRSCRSPPAWWRSSRMAPGSLT
jgi:hypothetical protein